jgi:hypothetical protein
LGRSATAALHGVSALAAEVASLQPEAARLVAAAAACPPALHRLEDAADRASRRCVSSPLHTLTLHRHLGSVSASCTWHRCSLFSAVHCSLRFSLSTVHSPLFTLHCSHITVHRSPFRSLFTLHCAKCSLCSLCTLHIQCAVCDLAVLSVCRVGVFVVTCTG